MVRIFSRSCLAKIGQGCFRKMSVSPQAQPVTQEILIPTSYGHIAGKVWGPENGRKVLALHGWQDNCGTFDTLIPLLPSHLRIVAIDFPGHGLSTHKPVGSIYGFTDLLLDVKTVSAHLNWSRYSLIGHSMGAGVSTIYSCCFPEEIEALVTLDGMDPDIIPPSNYVKHTASMVRRIAAMNEKIRNPAPKYSYEVAHKRLLEGQKDFMTDIGVSLLMKRAVRPSDEDSNMYIFTRDIRLQAFNFQVVSSEIWKEFLENLQCNLLCIKAKNGAKVRSTEIQEFLMHHFKDRKQSVEVIQVEGLHHVHLEHPERVAGYMSKFFSKDIQNNI